MERAFGLEIPLAYRVERHSRMKQRRNCIPPEAAKEKFRLRGEMWVELDHSKLMRVRPKIPRVHGPTLAVEVILLSNNIKGGSDCSRTVNAKAFVAFVQKIPCTHRVLIQCN